MLSNSAIQYILFSLHIQHNYTCLRNTDAPGSNKVKQTDRQTMPPADLSGREHKKTIFSLFTWYGCTYIYLISIIIRTKFKSGVKNYINWCRLNGYLLSTYSQLNVTLSNQFNQRTYSLKIDTENLVNTCIKCHWHAWSYVNLQSKNKTYHPMKFEMRQLWCSMAEAAATVKHLL